MYSKQVLSALLLASSAFFTSAASLRSNRRRLADNSECTLLVAEYLQIPGEEAAPDSSIDCGMDDGMIYSIQATASQKEVLKQKWENGEIASGATSLGLGVGAFEDSNGVFLPPGLDVAANLRRGPRHERRRLKAPLTGDKPILVVKVTDSGGLARAESPAQIGDDVFGTLGDPVNLKSQLFDCSHGQMNVVPGTIPNASVNQAAPGVIEVSINISLTNNDRYAVHNAVTAAVNAKLGINLVNGWDQITEPYHQVMYVTEKCYTGCGWAAYAYINGWMSVYQNVYYKQVGVQVHELGHNFGLYHSGGLDGATYTDHTGMMGNPLYSDDIGKMCYNAAKNWAITWYEDAKLLINPIAEPSTTVNLVGIADYDLRDGRPVVVKLETGLADKFYIGFNRATRANSDNDEADDEVTIVKANSDGTSQSYLQAHLVQGESHTIVNFAGSGKDLIITANTIDLSTNPGQATVSIVYQSGPTVAPTSAPTSSPTASPTASPTSTPTASPTSTPTASPTASPTIAPTPAPTQPTAAPSSSPTSSPTNSPTKAPTLPPTSAPTPSPTPFDTCSVYPNGGKCKKASGCSWNGFRCVSDGAPTAPTSPVAAPSPEPPVGGPGPSECIASGLSCDLGTCCSGQCQRNGRWANTCK